MRRLAPRVQQALCEGVLKNACGMPAHVKARITDIEKQKKAVRMETSSSSSNVALRPQKPYGNNRNGWLGVKHQVTYLP